MGITDDGIATPDVQTILYSAAAVSASEATATATPDRHPDGRAAIRRRTPGRRGRGCNEGADAPAIPRLLQRQAGRQVRQRHQTGRLVSFQTKNNLTSDGICGTETIKVLFSDSAVFYGAAPTATPQTTAKVVITEDTATIQTGSIGIAVLNLQRRLYELGYYISRLDGVYLEEDMNAVKLFQKTNGLTADGKAGYETQKLLFSTSAKAAPVNASTEEDNLAVCDAAVRRYRNGSDRDAEPPDRTGLPAGRTADGTFGLKTKEAVVIFQRENGLVRDGVAGGKTLAAMYSDSAADNTIDTSVTLAKGTVSATVRKMQEQPDRAWIPNGQRGRRIRHGDHAGADRVPERTEA